MIIKALIFSVGVVAIVFASLHKPLLRPEAHELLAPPQQLKHFAFGYHEVLADTLWLRVVQDFDTCGHLNTEGAADPLIEDVVNREHKQRVGRCENSWVFHMIDAITELAPSFRIPYATGGTILSVAVDDIAGATQIWSKAVGRFPADWRILYNASYHYLYEVGDRTEAARLLVESSKNGGPYWLDLLASRLYSKTGKAALGKAVMMEFLEKNPEQADNEHFKLRMAEIERDLAAGDGPEATPAPESAAAAKQPTELPKKKQ